MAPRIGLVQLWQESNGFNPVATVRADFEAMGLACGAEALARHGGANELGGFTDGLAGWGEAVGILHAEAWPAGPLTAGTFAGLCDDLCRELAAAGRLDGLLVSLHGGLLAAGSVSADTDILRTIRAVVGPRPPLVATLDLHAQATPEMTAAADALVPYLTSPHIDRRETGRRAARVLRRLLDGATARTALVRLPMLTPSEGHQTSGPVLAPLFAEVAALEARPDILAAGILMTQPWLDVPDQGWSVLVTGLDEERCRAEADRLARRCWMLKERLLCAYATPAEAVARAAAAPAGPVVIADGPDATNSGAPGHSTTIIAALLAAPLPGRALAMLVDAAAVAQAQAAGEGGCFRGPIGPPAPTAFCSPLQVHGSVLRLGRARFALHGHLADGAGFDLGQAAVLRLDRLDLLVVERAGPGSTPDLYRSLGLEPRDYHAVVVKSPAGFRAEYGPFAADIILTSHPGAAQPDLPALPFRRLSRPLWPFDAIADPATVGWSSAIASRRRPLGTA